MTVDSEFLAGGYRLAADRGYDRDTHLWVKETAKGGARCGFDPLGAETCGDIVAVSLTDAGTRVARGEELGALEAAKFVGPLISPVSGLVTAHNPEVLADPSLLNADPLRHWLIEIRLSAAETELAGLLRGEEAVRPWFEAELERFRRQGMVAE